MIRKLRLLFLLVLLPAPGLLRGQAWSGIINASRAIDWTAVGIPGGIPARTTICSSINAATYGSGTSDATSGIQTALNACPAGQTVLLSSGTFLIKTSLTIPSNVTLRGAGANNSILNIQGATSGAINFGSGPDPAIVNSTPITSGATAGSTSIVISNVAGIKVGGYLMITELNDPAYVTITTPNGTCTWCDGGMGWNGVRVRGQIVQITSVNGTTIGITPGLYSAYSLTPLATLTPIGAVYAGAENFQVYSNNTGYTTNFLMMGTAYCWIKGVEGNFADGDHVQAHWSYRGEIRDSYFHDGWVHAAGTTDDDVFIADKSTGFLVENNIMRRMHISIMLNWGAAGNVIAYNYSDGDYDDSATNAILGDMSVHGAHPQFNLWEGNVFVSLYPDSYWGSSGNNTAFRNFWRGTSQICVPYSSRSSPGACHWAIQAIRGVQPAYTVSNLNMVGNVVGSDSMTSLTHYNDGKNILPQVASIVNPATRSYDDAAYGYTWGYYYLSDAGAGSPANSFSSRFVHGDFNNVDGSLTWDAGTANHILPASFYLNSKPTWFGSVPYPPIGPDVTGGTGQHGHTYSIPAQACFNSSSSDGLGGIVFSASACYTPAGGSTILPPTNVSVVVH